MSLSSLHVSLSLSTSPDLETLGLPVNADVTAIGDISKALLAEGMTIHTGLDMRPCGGGEAILQAAVTHGREKSIVLHANQYYETGLETATSTTKDAIDKFVEVEPAPMYSTILNLDSQAQVIMSHVRHDMINATVVHIFAGGAVQGYGGPFSGIVEECWYALAREDAVYLLGGFGGATADLISILKGTYTANTRLGRPTEASQTKLAGYEKWLQEDTTVSVDHYQLNQDLPDLDLAPFAEDEDQYWNVISARNGLSLEENDRLAISRDVNEIIQLILKGLRALDDNTPSRPLFGA